MEFLQRASTGRKKLLGELGARFKVREGKARKSVRRIYDTFDWRLHRAGQRMEEVREAGARAVEWREMATEKILGRLGGQLPVFAAGWPPGPLQDRLTQIIKMRALLPLVEMKTTAVPVELCDGRKKIIARLAFEKTQLVLPGGAKAIQLPGVLRVAGVRGFAEELEEALEGIRANKGFEPSALTTLERAFAAAGLKPSSYTSKLNVKLVPGMRTEEAMRAIFSRLADIMEENLAGTVAAVDTEFLHDFRVAVRRTRSALGQMKSAVPGPVLGRFRPAFDRLGALTGPTRDLDVYLLKFDAYAAGLSPETREALEPLRSHLTARLTRERALLAKELGSRSHRDFCDKWRSTLGRPWKSRAPGYFGQKPVEAVAGRRILKIHKRVLKLGALLEPESPPPAVHVLRIACKKLRYMVEFFRSLYPEEECQELLELLKELQDTLGDFQDYEVHRQNLYCYAAELMKNKGISARTLVAVGELAESLAARQREARSLIGGRFAHFGSAESVERFRSLFGVGEGSG